MKSSRPIDKVFQDASDELATLITRTKYLRRLTQIFRSYLDTDLAPHCYIGNIEGSALTIMVDGPGWATKLRFLAPDLLRNLTQGYQIFSGITQIKVKVLTNMGEPTVTVIHAGPQMNQENGRGIETLARGIDDPELQKALQKLARHAKPDGN